MRLLSEAIDRVYCPTVVSSHVDDSVALGLMMIGEGVAGRDAQATDDLTRQASLLLANRDFLAPREGGQRVGEFFNDLYTPGTRLEDGIFHVHFPVAVAVPLSSSLLGGDWRFVLLASMVVPDAASGFSKVVMSAFDYSGRVVRTIEDAVFFKRALENAGRLLGLTSAKAGALCSRCSTWNTCPVASSYFSNHEVRQVRNRDLSREVRAQQLFFERMEIQSRVDFLEKRKKEVDRDLLSLACEGSLKLGDGQVLEFPRSERTEWDYARVFNVLSQAGLWDNSFAAIRGGVLAEAAAKFPFPIQEALKPAKIITKAEPSLGAAASHARFAPSKILLRGVSK